MPSQQGHHTFEGYIINDTEEIYENSSLIEAYSKNYPFGSLTPEDIVGTVDFLLSDKASKVIGESIIIDGGFSINGSIKIDM